MLCHQLHFLIRIFFLICSESLVINMNKYNITYLPGAGFASGGTTAMVVVIVLLTYLTAIECDLK